MVGEALVRRSFWRPAIEALKTSLALEENADVRQRYDALRAEHGFRIVNYEMESDLKEPRLCIRFSELLQKGVALVVERLQHGRHAHRGAARARAAGCRLGAAASLTACNPEP